MRTLLLSFILILFFGITLFRGSSAKAVIDGDGSGYYAYLPTVFHYRSTDFSSVYEVEKKHKSLSYNGHYFHKHGSILINKYFLGTALAQSPFYLAATAYSLAFGMPTDGYHILYQLAVAMAAVFYLAIGLLALLKLLRLYGFEKYIAFMVVLILVFGTNLFFYAFLHPSHSHIYSFAAVALFVMYSRSFFVKNKLSQFYFAALALGMVALIRPTNLLIVLAIPFVAGSRQSLVSGGSLLLRHVAGLLAGLLIFAMVFGIQFLFNYVQTGTIFLWSYKNEGFDFLHSHFFPFLFGFKKGFFVYTPIMLGIFPGLVILYRKTRFTFFMASGFLLAFTFIVSSWWNWFYGDSFGMRAMIDVYPVFALPLAFTVDKLVSRRPGFVFFLVIVLLFSALNLTQTYQYHRGILHHDSMSREKYSYVFLKTDNQFIDVLGGDAEPYFREPLPLPGYKFINTLESQQTGWSQNGLIRTQEAYSGVFAALMNSKNEFSPTLILDQNRLTTTNSPVYVKASLKYNPLEPFTGNKAMLVYAATNKKNSIVFYKSFKLTPMPGKKINTWHESEFGFKVPAWDADLAQVKVYLWNPAKDSFLIDDIIIEFYLTNDLP